MSPSLWSASTRTHSERPGTALPPLLRRGDVVASCESRLSYAVDRLLGQGGYGQVYLAARRGRSTTVPERVCVKVSPRQDGWLREAYFGQLLDDHPHAIRIFDAFPVIRANGEVLYCLAIEFAPHGDLSAFLRRTGKRWSERSARREIAGLLQVLGKLHRGQTLHRDLTPLNVFVCDGPRLKLGDFGIARQQSDRRGITARTLNPHMAPSDIFDGAAPKWQARDDVYQVGQLVAMLIKGDATARIRTPDVRSLPCSDHLKEIVHRCIGARHRRYESAAELIDALERAPTTFRSGVVRSLHGVHVAFTGIFRESRRDVAKAATRAGAIVHGMPSAKTTVVVRGHPNPRQAAGNDAGLKLMEIKRLAEKGHRITLITEQAFWRLVERVRAATPAATRRRGVRRATTTSRGAS